MTDDKPNRAKLKLICTCNGCWEKCRFGQPIDGHSELYCKYYVFNKNRSPGCMSRKARKELEERE